MPTTGTEVPLTQPVSLTRQELFERVWSTPLLHLAPTYGVHHVRLAQLCDDHEVPRPPRGYWSQKAFGKDAPRPDLPAVDDPAIETVIIAPDEPTEPTLPAPTTNPVPTPTAVSASPTAPPVPLPTKVEATTSATPVPRPQATGAPGLVKLSRQELYDIVWSAPMSQVCQDYNISDVALAKTCKRHRVPSPPRGYWAQLRTGVGVKKPALKPINDTKLEKVEIYRRARPEVSESTGQQAQECAATEKKAENKITVLGALDDPHPLIERTVKSLSSAKPNDRGLVRPRAARCLEVEVSPALVDRAGRILDALIRALEDRGHSMTAGEGEGPKTCVTVLSEKLSIRLEESLNCEEKVESFLDHRREYTYTPSGMLCLRINESAGSGHRRQWSDGKKRLEDALNAVVVALVRAAETIKAVREGAEKRERERKEEQRQREEREKRQRQEAARVQDFEQKLAAWERADRIRAFVTAARAAAVARDGPITSGSALEHWITWALRRADRIDPLTAERPERQWPPPKGHAVKVADERYRNWWVDGTNGTPVLPPDAATEPSDG